ncbi:MAG: DNA helicase RecQ [Candidatus Marinimicrobia bacterium]|nr:DNA helicase RecQ [Candidatus Neomarinimicrobiota bacterium]
MKTNNLKEKSLQKLENVFGYKNFRENQYEIIEKILLKENSVVIMPTGSGKSLCYQIPALILDGLAVVISPLISLMENQVNQLLELGIKANYLNSSLTKKDYNKVIANIRTNEIDLLYIAPETAMLPFIQEILQSVKVEYLAIDEAHCISEWGHDFRPEYRALVDLRKQLGNIPVIALTATATKRVQNDIAENLKLEKHNLFKSSFDRKNLFLEVIQKSDSTNQVTNFLDKFPNESSIIYCATRKGVDELTERLIDRGYSALNYHAGLTNEERKINQEKFIKDDVQIIVATIAFGMGIDKPNVKTIIHYNLPKNIETYYQQIGRAGRNGEDAFCLLLYSYSDIHNIKFWFREKKGNELKVAYAHLEAIINFAETKKCRRKVLLKYFGEEYEKENCQTCDNCTKEKEVEEDLTIPVQKFLSCIYRTGQFFGANHIIKILRGSEDKRIFEKGHDRISTYGIGEDLSYKQWLHLSRQLIREKIIRKDEQYGSLLITKEADKILRDEKKYFGNLIEEKTKVKEKMIAKDYDEKLFEILRKRRKEIADEKNLPPYTIFHDTTLIDICNSFPKTENELLNIYGIGKAKLEKYGDELLSIVNHYVENSE